MIPTIRRAMAYFNATVPTFGEMTPVELREQQIARQRCRSQPTCERADARRSRKSRGARWRGDFGPRDPYCVEPATPMLARPTDKRIEQPVVAARNDRTASGA